MHQPPYCPLPANTMPNSSEKYQPTPYHTYKNQNYCFTHGHHIEINHTSQTCKTLAPNHNQNTTKFNTMDGSNAGAHRSTAIYPAPDLSVNPAQITYSGAPQDSLPDPITGDGAEEEKQQNQMMMPTMIGQPTMIDMAGRMSGNTQQPMANFGYGNNMNFYGANMGNNMGYGQKSRNMNNF